MFHGEVFLFSAYLTSIMRLGSTVYISGEIPRKAPYMYMMSVVKKSTCSGFKTRLYISYHGRNAVRYIISNRKVIS